MDIQRDFILSTTAPAQTALPAVGPASSATNGVASIAVGGEP
jgi:hypothetical protein